MFHSFQFENIILPIPALIVRNPKLIKEFPYLVDINSHELAIIIYVKIRSRVRGT